jgi:hypothetical protein
MKTYNYYVQNSPSINDFDVQVEVNGRPVKKYCENNKLFIESRKGTKYSIKIKNKSSVRGMAIISVDGVDVITGKEAASADGGYIVDAFGTLEVNGYRISDSEVASFVFTERDKSYTKEVTGSSTNAGVIGVRLYGEKTFAWWTLPYYSSAGTVTPQFTTVGGGTYGSLGPMFRTGQSIGTGQSINAETLNRELANYTSTLSNNVANASLDHGTTWGSKEIDTVVKTSFTKGQCLGDVIIYYASKEKLKQFGIKFEKVKKISELKTMPSAFGETVYCKPPAGWRG